MLAPETSSERSDSSLSLPPASLAHLDEFSVLLEFISVPDKLELIKRIVAEGYIEALAKLFQDFESSSDFEATKKKILPKFGLIFKRLVKINSAQIIEQLLSHDVVRTTFAALDCMQHLFFFTLIFKMTPQWQQAR